MWIDDYKWHYDYVRLAWDAGFSFGKCYYSHSDKNKIYLIDTDRIVKERDVASVERYIPTVVQYVLENDKAEILDTNFVNLFRMSQLSVEYLLFCKRYLDNTVTILKKDITKLKQEIKELKLYTGELETHLSVLSKNGLMATFRCEKCMKAFSTEEYLKSHIKRRHNDEEKPAPNIEAEKLHLEIKDLKERLNNTEKLVQKDNSEVESAKLRDDELCPSKLINEIQKNFEKFREQVENRIESLQSEKKSHDEKYNKLFDVVLEYRKKDITQTDKLEAENTSSKHPAQQLATTESTTQTDQIEKSQSLHIETFQTDNLYHFKEASSTEELAVESGDANEILDKKINSFGENIENKISTGLVNIENQMKAFWDKLTELESNQNNRVYQVEHPEEQPHSVIAMANGPKPKIKPRTKFSKPTTLSKSVECERQVEQIRLELDEVLNAAPKKELPPKIVQSAAHHTYNKSNSETESDSESAEEQSDSVSDCQQESEVKVEVITKPKTTSDKKHIPSNKSIPVERSVKKANPVDVELLKVEAQKEIIGILHSKLQEMGISPNWKGIPKKTFEISLEIIEHQAALNKKFLPNYESVKKSIEKSIGKKNSDRNLKETVGQSNWSNMNKEKPSVIKIRYKKKPKGKENLTHPVVTIKNRSLYDTDSENEPPNHKKASLPAAKMETVHAAVIEELKFVQSKSLPSKTSEETDSDLNSTILFGDDKNLGEAKSSMKSYPSDGSLVKKKVLFNIEGTDTEENVSLRKGDSKTDLARQMKNVEKTTNADSSSLSDFEIS